MSSADDAPKPGENPTRESELRKSRAESAASSELQKLRSQLAETSLRLAKLETELRGIRSSAPSKLSRILDALPRMAARVLPDLARSRGPHARAARLVEASDLFDRKWYESQNPDVADKGFDAALHYVSYGASEGRDPGPNFNTRDYLETHKDVAEVGLNPLVHYVLHGKAEGRKIRKSSAAPRKPERPAPPSEPAVVASDVLSFAFPQAAEMEWTRQKDIGHKDGHLTLELSGVVIGTVPIPDGPKQGAWTAAADSLPVLAAYCRVMGLEPRHALSCYVEDAPIDCAGALGGPIAVATFADAWYVNDRDMRIRFDTDQPCVACFFQSDPSSGALSVVGEAMLADRGVAFADLALLSAFMPVVVTLATPQGRLLSTTLLPFPSLCRGGVHYGELCAVGSEANYLKNLRTVSESLLRSKLDAAAEFAIGRVEVDLQDATGAERIFSTELREWLLAVMHVVPRPANTAAVPYPKVRAHLEQRLAAAALPHRQELVAAAVARERAGPAVLTLPADGVPSLNALVSRTLGTSRDAARRVGSYVLAENATGNPLWRVGLPPLGDELLAVQPASARIDFPIVTGAADGPLAVRFRDQRDRHPASLIMPVALEAPGPLLRASVPGLAGNAVAISVLLASSGQSRSALAALLESLRQQTVAECLEIIVTVNGTQADERDAAQRALERLFSGRYQLVDPTAATSRVERINRAADMANGKFLLVVGADVALHDPRTLETLCAIANQERIASAGCVLVRASATKKTQSAVFHSGGYFPCLPAGIAEPAFRELDCADIFPLATYPVAGNSSALFLVRAEVWRVLGGFNASGYSAQGDLDYGLRAAAEGFRHLCTSVVSAEIYERDFNGAPVATAPEGSRHASWASRVEALRP